MTQNSIGGFHCHAVKNKIANHSIQKLRLILGVKTCEVFLCFLAIVFLGSIVLTSQWLLCIHCFTSLVSFTGFYTEVNPKFQNLGNKKTINMQKALPRIRSVRYFICEIFGMETPCLCPFEGHKYGCRKPTETSVFEFFY